MTRASDKVSVALPTPRSTKKPLRFNHLTTTGFYGVQPLMYRELIVKESIKGSASVFVRSNPLVLPVMSGIRFNYHKFFVRYKDVFPAWDDFDTGSKHFFSSVGVRTFALETPYTTHAELSSYITSVGNLCTDVTSAFNDDNSTLFDFIMKSDGKDFYYRFTQRGFRLNKLLNSLGIIVIWDSTCTEKISLMPLLCFVKAYCDWYIPNQYLNSNQTLVDFQNTFSYDTNVVAALPITNPSDVYSIFLIKFCNFEFFSYYDDNDLYAAWDNPTGPVGNSLPPYEITDNSNSYPFNTFTDNHHSVQFNQVDNYHNSNGTPSVVSELHDSNDIAYNSSSVYRLNQYILDSLRHVTNAVRRMQLVGARNVDRFLAKYGIKLNDDHRAMLLGSQTLSLNVGDVEANSDGTNGVHQSNLGDLAGKGVTLGDIDFECSSGSHQGLFMILCSTLADTSLVQGFDPMWIHTVPNDYYQPDFDHLGTSAIPKYAVFATQYGNYSSGANGVFGYMPRYYEYNLNRDLMTGAFRTPTQGSRELMGYHTYRYLPNNISYEDIVHSLSFLSPNIVDRILTNRVFYNDQAVDQFIMRWRSNFVSTSPKRPLKDVYDWGDDEKNGLLDMHATTSNVQ